jgi:hypothetical protein
MIGVFSKNRVKLVELPPIIILKESLKTFMNIKEISYCGTLLFGGVFLA